jgi:stalled ribosome rescue protein Dom34
MTSSHFHAVIWIDHRQARVFHFNLLEQDQEKFHPHNASVHVHHKASTVGSGHETMEPAFMKEVIAAVSAAGEILVIGPGTAKGEFMSYIEKHDPKFKAKVLGVETVDHPTDGQIVAYARKFFKPLDEMLPR